MAAAAVENTTSLCANFAENDTRMRRRCTYTRGCTPANDPSGRFPAFFCFKNINKNDFNSSSFRCNFCDKSFTNQGNMQVHQRVHTGEKPYRCDACGKSYAQKVGLKIHQEQCKVYMNRRGSVLTVVSSVNDLASCSSASSVDVSPPPSSQTTKKIDGVVAATSASGIHRLMSGVGDDELQQHLYHLEQLAANANCCVLPNIEAMEEKPDNNNNNNNMFKAFLRTFFFELIFLKWKRDTFKMCYFFQTRPNSKNHI